MTKNRKGSNREKEEKFKEDVERFVCKVFLEKCKPGVTIIRHGDPNKKEPDFMCDDGSGVEITGLYAGKEDERQLNKMNQGKKDSAVTEILHEGKVAVRVSGDISTSDGVPYMCQQIIEKIKKHRNGNYERCKGEVYLVCNALFGHSMAFPEQSEIDGLRKMVENDPVYKKNGKQFAGIYILWTPGKPSPSLDLLVGQHAAFLWPFRETSPSPESVSTQENIVKKLLSPESVSTQENKVTKLL